MLHKISELNGVRILKKDQQQSINAGGPPVIECHKDSDCPPGTTCKGCFCLGPNDPV
ncbi:hypothetical protein [Aquimarina celericrescens]|uniref:Uncharacterized protein n=1 Tax=Aquimarina celericrescens TaxID=1964542 RepID=A0ABW5AVD2_9FLAO|nr:hypothetical protein [Aquimarina celericrescens]